MLLETAAICGVELSEPRIAGYLKHLQGFAEDKLEYAFNRVQQEWKDANKMPTLEFILTRCTEYSTHRIADHGTTQEILDRDEKPSGWEPVSHEQVIAWREEGKQAAIKQLAEIRKAAMRELNPEGRLKP